MVLIPPPTGLRPDAPGRIAPGYRRGVSLPPFLWPPCHYDLRLPGVGSATSSPMGSVLKMRVRQVALLAMLSILLSLVVAQPAAAAQRPAAAAATVTTVYLDVKTAVNSISSQGPKKGSAVTQYHWLLNLDNTGDPYTAQQALYCHPSTNVVATASTPVGDHGTYVATVGGYPNGCEWPSVRYAVASPALSEGTQADWNHFTPGTNACNKSGGGE